MSKNTAKETLETESIQIIENSVRYSLLNIRKLMIELEMLRIESTGLTDLADSLSDYHRTVLPVENARFSDDELHYKWSEQITRYRFTAKGIFEIFESKAERLTELISIAGDEVKKLPRPLPEDITNEMTIITQYSEDFSKLKSRE